MTPVLSRAQMREFDRHAMQACRVPGALLMENAGRGATDVLFREVLGGDAAGAQVVVVCGGGNNGGDGLVVARHLMVRGATAEVYLVGDPKHLGPDALANLEAWRGLGGAVHELGPGADSLPARACHGGGRRGGRRSLRHGARPAHRGAPRASSCAP